MGKAKSVPTNPVCTPPSKIVWTAERLAALDKAQLSNLLDNLQTQRSSGRVSEATAVELEALIRARLPARAATPRRRRPLSEVRMEARATERLGALARDLERRFDLSLETAVEASRETKGFKPHSMTDGKGQPRSGAAVKNGAAVIERYVGYRARDSFAGLAFVVLPGQEAGRGTYLLLGTSDLIDGEACAEYLPVVSEHGWSAESRSCMRAVAVADFGEGAARCADLIGRLAPALAPAT